MAGRIGVNGFFDALYRKTVDDWREIVGPKVARRLARLARSYEILSQQIDRDYAIGRTRGIEDKEGRAEWLLEEMEGIRDEYESAAGESTDEVFDVVRQLAATYAHPEKFVAREDWIANMRDTLESATLTFGRVRPSDSQILGIAQDAAARLASLRQRYKEVSR